MTDTKLRGSALQIRAGATALLPVTLIWSISVAWTTIDMGAAWYALGLVSLPVLVVSALTSEEMARRWGRDRGAVLESKALELLHRQVLFSRVGRTLGVTLAWATAVMVTGYYNTHTESFADGWARWQEFESAGGVWGLTALGYVVVSLIVELTKPRIGSWGSVAVVLDRRGLTDVLDPGLRRLVQLYGGVTACAAVAWLVVRLDSGGVRPSGTAMFVLGVGVGALGAAEWVSRRRQRAGDDAELAAEELTRSATANAMVGAAIAVLAYSTGSIVSALFEDPPMWVAILSLLWVLLALGIWIGSGTKFVFRSLRIDRLRAGA